MMEGGEGGYRAEPWPLAATLACNVISCVLAHWAPLSPPHNSPSSSLLSVLTLWNSCIKWLVKFEISLQCQEVAGISIRSALQVGLGHSGLLSVGLTPRGLQAQLPVPRADEPGAWDVEDEEGSLSTWTCRMPPPSHIERAPGQNH